MNNILRKFLRIASTLCLTSALHAATEQNIPPAHSEDRYLSTLPKGFMPFEEFEKEFALGNLTTEQLNPITKQLSQAMHKSIPQGMDLLLDVDENVIKGLVAFIPSIKTLAPALAEKIRKGGRVFLVGSGSSGRVGIDIAAKCGAKFPSFKEQILGIIAGGFSALIRAREGFEDSEADGEAALKDYHLGQNDIVILISASGSASFNVGCGHFAANQGASVYYFYNSQNIPVRTQRLFERSENRVVPLCLDIGPQAIGGSTRLQGATLAEACLGALLGSTLYLAQGQDHLSTTYPIELAFKMLKGLELIRDHLSSIQSFPKIEVQVFSNPHSNFRELKDVTNQGYVTFVALEDSMREVLIDATETSPTFSTNPIRRENEPHKKRAEFRAYLIGQETNRQAWKALLGRDVHPLDIKETENFLLACEEDGLNSFSKRPKDEGNFTIGVAKINETIPLPLIQILNGAKNQGGTVGLILICRNELSQEQVKELEETYDSVLVLQNTPSDALGFTETIVLKQVLNLISNSSMVLMNKVHGNQMIDVRASNKKLIDRCVRLVKDIWTEYHPDQAPPNKLLYHYVAHVSVLKKSYEENGIYTPSVVKIVLAMLALNKTPDHFQEVLDFLAEKQERVDWIGHRQQFAHP